MGLFSSIFSRSAAAGDAPAEAEAGDSVARARSRARQRLLGAVVLVGIGIIGFPLLFETQPRPIPIDVPIEIPSRDTVAPLKLPGAKNSSSTAGGAVKGSGENPSARAEPVITETAADAGTPVAGAKPAGNAAADGEVKSADKAAGLSAEKSVAKSATDNKPAEKPEVDRAADAKAAEQADTARARALLEGKAAPKDAAAVARYIVQIGAFADPTLARATRQKVERLGLTTYTHVAKTPDGDRTRVRVGPVASRDEAEKIAARIKAAGLPTAILTL